MYRKYYSYHDMPQVIKSEAKPEVIPTSPVHKQPAEQQGLFQDGKLFGKLETDDIILFVVILVLLLDDCDDKLLLLALGFVFLSGLL